MEIDPANIEILIGLLKDIKTCGCIIIAQLAATMLFIAIKK